MRTEARLGVAGGGLSLVAVAASAYLTAAHYSTEAVLACPNTGTINCAKVTTSSYATQFGIPLAVLGLAFFVATLAVQNPWAWRSPNPWIRRVRLAAAGAGAVGALWLIWVELFRLDAICLYCTVVHAAAILLFVLTGVGTALVET